MKLKHIYYHDKTDTCLKAIVTVYLRKKNKPVPKTDTCRFILQVILI